MPVRILRSLMLDPNSDWIPLLFKVFLFGRCEWKVHPWACLWNPKGVPSHRQSKWMYSWFQSNAQTLLKQTPPLIACLGNPRTETPYRSLEKALLPIKGKRHCATIPTFMKMAIWKHLFVNRGRFPQKSFFVKELSERDIKRLAERAKRWVETWFEI